MTSEDIQNQRDKIKAVQEEIWRLGFTVERLNRINALKRAIYAEELRLRLADEQFLMSQGLPKAVQTGSRAVMAKRNAELFSDSLLEREIAQLSERKRDRMSFEEREIYELMDRGMSFRLANFIQREWDWKDGGEDLNQDWKKWQHNERLESGWEFRHYRDDLSEKERNLIEITPIGSYSAFALKDALKALFADALAIPYKGKAYKEQHIARISSVKDGIRLSVGNAAGDGEKALEIPCFKPSPAPFRFTIGIEHLSRLSLVKKGVKAHPEKSVLDIETELQEEARELAVKGLVHWEETPLELAIESPSASLLLKAGNFIYRVPLLLSS